MDEVRTRVVNGNYLLGDLDPCLIFRSSPRQCPVRSTIGSRVRPSVYVHKSFSDFDLIWCVDSPRPHMRTSMTPTRPDTSVGFSVSCAG